MQANLKSKHINYYTLEKRIGDFSLKRMVFVARSPRKERVILKVFFMDSYEDFAWEVGAN